MLSRSSRESRPTAVYMYKLGAQLQEPTIVDATTDIMCRTCQCCSGGRKGHWPRSRIFDMQI